MLPAGVKSSHATTSIITLALYYALIFYHLLYGVICCLNTDGDDTGGGPVAVADTWAINRQQSAPISGH